MPATQTQQLAAAAAAAAGDAEWRRLLRRTDSAYGIPRADDVLAGWA